MKYVFDNSPLSSLFRNFYRSRFPTLWSRFDGLVAGGVVTSTREVARELDRYSHADKAWINSHRRIFKTPNEDELHVVRTIYAVRHFRNNIEEKKIQNGGLNADPFVVARAAANDVAVVTLEARTPNAAKIPNICNHLHVRCLDLEQFMEEEGWRF